MNAQTGRANPNRQVCGAEGELSRSASAHRWTSEAIPSQVPWPEPPAIPLASTCGHGLTIA